MTPSALLYCTLRCQHTHILKILWNFHLVLYFQNTLWHRYIHNRISFSHLSFCSNSLIWGEGQLGWNINGSVMLDQSSNCSVTQLPNLQSGSNNSVSLTEFLWELNTLIHVKISEQEAHSKDRVNINCCCNLMAFSTTYWIFPFDWHLKINTAKKLLLFFSSQ